MTRAAPARRRGGARVGNAGEDIADVLHAICERAGVASVRRVSSHVQITSSAGGELRARLRGKSTVDCLGWSSTGRIIAVEVKTVSMSRERGATKPLAFSMREVKPHQKLELDRVHAAGGLAVLLLIFGPRRYALPWDQVRGIKVLRGEVAEVWEVRGHRPYLEMFLTGEK